MSKLVLSSMLGNLFMSKRNDRTISVTLEYYMALFGTTKKRVINAIMQLEKRGFITVVYKYGKDDTTFFKVKLNGTINEWFPEAIVVNEEPLPTMFNERDFEKEQEDIVRNGRKSYKFNDIR